MQQIILHIDFDSFFASAEQQDNPLLRNRPIGVTATNGRTCIIAASREAKALGIKSPSRTLEARQICPSIVFVPAHFTRYWKISKKFIDICKDFSPYVEIFSLDEVFMDVTHTTELFGGTYPLIEKIKKRIREEIGECVTASFGISYNKLLAKLASGLEKPNGTVEINKDNLFKVYGSAKLTDICGIGNRINARLQNMGIRTLLHLNKAPLSALVAEFGNVEGNFLKNVGMGIDHSAVIPHYEAPDAKSVGRSYCMPFNEYDSRKVQQNVYELCEEVALKLRRLNKKARGVGISLRGDQNIHGNRTFSAFMNTGQEMFRACTALLSRKSEARNTKSETNSNVQNINAQNVLNLKNLDFGIISDFDIRISDFPLGGYVRQINIWAYHLKDSDIVPSSIFAEDQRAQKIIKIVDKINERFGTHTIRNGFLLNSAKLTTVPNGFMADRYEREKFAKEQTHLDSQ